MYDERDYMESIKAESLSRTISPVMKGVKENIISFRDHHIAVVPISEHIMTSFEQVSREMKSEKGKEMVVRLKPKIENIAKGVEVGAGTLDVVTGVIFAGLGVREGMRAKKDYDILKDKKSRIQDPVLIRTIAHVSDLHPLQKASSGVLDVGIAGTMLGVRPISRGVDAISGPLEKRVLRTMDAIFLRQEHKQPVRQIFVGKGKA